jgi:hypothetical protein
MNSRLNHTIVGKGQKGCHLDMKTFLVSEIRKSGMSSETRVDWVDC